MISIPQIGLVVCLVLVAGCDKTAVQHPPGSYNARDLPMNKSNDFQCGRREPLLPEWQMVNCGVDQINLVFRQDAGITASFFKADAQRRAFLEGLRGELRESISLGIAPLTNLPDLDVREFRVLGHDRDGRPSFISADNVEGYFCRAAVWAGSDSILSCFIESNGWIKLIRYPLSSKPQLRKVLNSAHTIDRSDFDAG